MLGSNPRDGSKTTRLPVRILPLRLTFVDGGITLDGDDVIADAVGSPVFQAARFRSGHTQYGDAMQRAMFWDDVRTHSRGYHVLLNAPDVLPPLSLVVPRGDGFAFQSAAGKGGVLSSRYAFSLLPRLERLYNPSSGLLVLLDDVVGDTFLGFHFAYTPPGQPAPGTVMWAPYLRPRVNTDPAFSDAFVLSHEVAEWISDPFGDNVVPAWIAPGTDTCFDDVLEVADPLEFVAHGSFAVTMNRRTYHLADVASLSWFTHDVPSRELGGAYSYNGALKTPSKSC
jgi:hypothetical protein